MKDYYKILGVPEDASQEDIKRAFRRLAFQHHPDTNPGNEKQAEARFKEINEAFAVLGDEKRRQEYDMVRKGQLAGVRFGTGPSSFDYSQQEIFQNIFSGAIFEEISRICNEAGLRFDQDFVNKTYFGGRAFVFKCYTAPPSDNGSGPSLNGAPEQTAYVYKPGRLEKLFTRLLMGTLRLFLRLFLGQSFETAKPGLDIHSFLELSREEADRGGEKEISYQRGRESRRVVVKVPRGVESGMKIRLRGLGLKQNKKSGDLYLHVRVRD